MAKIRIEILTATASSVADQHGFEGLTLSTVANELDVAPSALYTHCQGLDGLRTLVAVAATERLADRIRTAAVGTSGSAALVAMGRAYRRFTLDHPGQFAAILRLPHANDPELRSAGRSIVEVFDLVFTATGLPGDQSRLAARNAHSAIHGFLALEHVTGTNEDDEDEYLDLLQALPRLLDLAD